MFRRVLILVAIISLVYMVAVDLTVVFQWYMESSSLLPLLKLRNAAVPPTMPGIEPMKVYKVTASTLMTFSLAAAQSTSLSTF